MNRSTMRKLHRWLGLLTGLQLLAWTLSGLYFTLIPIAEIRGNQLLKNQEPAPPVATLSLLSPSAVAALHPQLADVAAAAFSLQTASGSPVYVFGDVRVDATTGALLGNLDQEDAERLVRDRTGRPIVSATRVTEVPAGDEYRGGELPAWRVVVSGEENAAVYVGASSGRVRAVRTDSWRFYDWLWGLHIMDYEEREDFNHLLVQALAVLGLITVISGLALFFMTQRWALRQR